VIRCRVSFFRMSIGALLKYFLPRVRFASAWIGSTAVAWSLWYRGYATAPPTVSAAAFFAQPIVGAALGVLILGEVLGPPFLAGSALVLGGVLLIAARERSGRAA
jgi:drug/metabolite transporter (DMT)-like permease